MFDFLIGKVRTFFVRSKRIHLRQDPAQSVEELISLIDRFLDGLLRYGFEWDDFISWKNSYPKLEEIRNRINEFGWLLSDKEEDRILYGKKLIEERNRLAALLSLPLRDPDPLRRYDQTLSSSD